MADKNPAAADDAPNGPTYVEMHRAVHELRTGTKADEKIKAGTVITNAVAKAHKLSDDDLTALAKTGAVAMVEVLKD